MHNKTTFTLYCSLLAMAALVLLTACGSGQYRNQPLGINVQEAEQISQDLAEIRRQGVGEVNHSLESLAAPGLLEYQQEALAFLFTEFAKAQETELIDLDRFGDQVYRASFTIRNRNSGENVIHVILVKTNGKLYWAGLN